MGGWVMDVNVVQKIISTSKHNRILCAIQCGSDCLAGYQCVCVLVVFGVQCGSDCLGGYLCVSVLGVYSVAVTALGDTCVSVCLLSLGCTVWQ